MRHERIRSGSPGRFGFLVLNPAALPTREVIVEHQRARRRSVRVTAIAAAALALSTGCNKPPPLGKIDEIIVATPPHLWKALEPEIRAALEPRAFTVRDERMFDVAYLEPSDKVWDRRRRMRQVLLIGSKQQPLVAQALGRKGDELTPPVVVQRHDVWAKPQLVTIALLPEAAEAAELPKLLPKVGDVYQRQFGGLIRTRMTTNPPNELVAARLRQVGGFALKPPMSYESRQPGPNLFVFEDDTPGFGTMLRTITVASQRSDSVAWSAEAAEGWRAELAERLNRPRHLTEARPGSMEGHIAGQPTIQIQGVWSTPPDEWPSAGPFLSRIVGCSERVFLIDAWLYAPADDKYQDMYELEVVFDTFRCPGRA